MLDAGTPLRTLSQTMPALAVTIILVTAGACVALPAPTHARPTATVSAGAEEPTRYVKRSGTIGRSVKGRRIKAFYRGDRDAEHVLVVLGQMHGDERAGRRTAWWIRDHVRPRAGTGIWVVPTMNPDGNARGTRTNARRVDLNRNWPTSGWSRAGKGGRYWGGTHPASEPETRALMRFLRAVKPDYIASLHQPLHGIGRNGRDRRWELRLSRHLGLPRKYFGVGNPSGTVSPTMTGWYNRRLRRHGVATTIEYGARPAGRYVTVRAGKGITRAARVR